MKDTWLVENNIQITQIDEIEKKLREKFDFYFFMIRSDEEHIYFSWHGVKGQMGPTEEEFQTYLNEINEVFIQDKV